MAHHMSRLDAQLNRAHQALTQPELHAERERIDKIERRLAFEEKQIARNERLTRFILGQSIINNIKGMGS